MKFHKLLFIFFCSLPAAMTLGTGLDTISDKFDKFLADENAKLGEYTTTEAQLFQTISKEGPQSIPDVCHSKKLENYFKIVDALYDTETIRLQNEPNQSSSLFSFIWKFFGFGVSGISNQTFRDLSFVELINSSHIDFYDYESRFQKESSAFELALKKIDLFANDLGASLKFLKHLSDIATERQNKHNQAVKSQEAKITKTEAQISTAFQSDQTQQTALKQEIFELENSILLATKTIEDAKKTYPQLRSENKDLEIKIQELDQQLKTKQAAESNLLGQRDSLNQQIRAKTDELNRKTKNKTNDEQKAIQIAKDLAEIKKKIEEAQERQKESMADSWSEVGNQYQENQKISNLLAKQKNLQQEQSRLGSIQASEATLKNLKTSLASLQTQITETQKIYKNLQTARNNLAAKLSANQKLLAKKLDEQAEKQISAATQKISKKNVTLTKLPPETSAKISNLEKQLATERHALNQILQKWEQTKELDLEHFSRVEFMNLTPHQEVVSEGLAKFAETFPKQAGENFGILPSYQEKLLKLISKLLKSGSDIQLTLELFLPSNSVYVLSPYLTLSSLKSQNKHLSVENAVLMGKHLLGFQAQHKELLTELDSLTREFGAIQRQNKNWFDTLTKYTLEDSEKLALLLTLVEIRRWESQENFSWSNNSRGGWRLIHGMGEIAAECLKAD